MEKEHKKQIKKKAVIISAALIIISGFLVYFNSINGQFIWDDDYLVKYNVYIKNWSNIKNIFTQNIGAGAGREFSSWRPLQMVTYMLDYSLWGLDVRGYHLTNILLHVLAALGVYWLLLRLYRDNALSLFAGILFVVHPVHTEAVAYISGRADSLALVFILLTFILYIRQLDLSRPYIYMFMLLSYIFALLSRENSLILPVLVLLYHYVFKKKVRLKELLSLFGIGFIYILLRLTLLRSLLPHITPLTNSFQRIPGFFVAIANYLRLILLPFNLHMEYGNRIFYFTDFKVILGIVLVFSLLTYAAKIRKTNGLIFLSISWFFIALLPVSNIYPIYAYMAEHWLYLPSIGLFFILARIMRSLYKNRKIRVLSILFIIALPCFYGYLTIKQNNYWNEPINFYEQTLRYAPYSSRMYNNLGNEYNNAGKYKQAISLFRKAIEIEPGYAEVYNNLANSYAYIGDKKEAIAWYKKAIEINPAYVEAHSNLGVAYYDIGEIYQAIAWYKKAIEINPNHAGAYNNLANAYIDIGRTENAIVLYKKAIGIDPHYAKMYNNLANLYGRMGNITEAIAWYKKAIEINPADAEAYNNLSVVYFYQQQYKLAIQYYDKARESGFNNPQLLEVLKPYRRGE